MSETANETKGGFWRRLTGGLKRTSSALGSAISDLVTKRKLDAETISEIKDVLVRADLGLDTADRIGDALAEGRHDKAISPAEVNAVVAAEVEKVLDPVAQPIFDKLRAHRAEVARSRGVPAYVVALDRTLIEMAQVRPRTADQLLMLHGMGPARAEQYGEGFLRVLSS